MTTKYLLQITAGQGPDECALAIAKVLPILFASMKKSAVTYNIVDKVEGNKPNTYKSVILELEGKGASTLKEEWEGTIQWVCESPYRLRHKRKNWFVSIKFIDMGTEHCMSINKESLKIDTMKASGPGGQHVNKTNSAIRITHVPTGISVVSQSTPSQHQNKQIALIKLQEKLSQMRNNQSTAQQCMIWEEHSQVVRGKPTKVFQGEKFLQKK